MTRHWTARRFDINLVVFILIFLAFVLRLYRLGSVEFWFDEAATYIIAQKGLLGNLDFARLTPNEHLPLYYWFMVAWMQVTGSSEFAMRFFSVWFGIVFIALLYRLARREFGIHVALGAALVAAFSPFMFMYSQEARMYTLVPVLTLLSMGFFLQFVRDGRTRSLLKLAFVSLLGVATHYYFSLTFLGEFIYFLIQWRSILPTSRVHNLGMHVDCLWRLCLVQYSV